MTRARELLHMLEAEPSMKLPKTKCTSCGEKFRLTPSNPQETLCRDCKSILQGNQYYTQNASNPRNFRY